MIVAGFGFSTAATTESLRAALDSAAAGRAVDRLAAPADKAGAECLAALAATLALPVAAVSADALRAVETATQSDRVQAERRVGSVAEAAALAALAPGGRLLSARHISSDRLAACAVAIGDPL